MSRRCEGGVVLAICQLMQETEVPELFALWGSLSAVSACLGRNVFIDQGHFTVYPNLYVILTAGSAKCRKSTMIGKVEDLLKSVEPPLHLMSQKSTPQALIAEMCGIVPETETSLVNAATGLVIADEVSTFIDKNAFNSGMIPVLTKLYDCKDFDYHTRSHGVELISDPCLSILGGSTIQWIKEAVPEVSIGGGFTARIIFVFQDSRNKNVPWPVANEAARALQQDIIHDLCEIRRLTGPFAVNNKAKDVYCEEYNTFSDRSDLFNDPNMAGYAGRRHVMVLKLSMAFSAARGDSREVIEEDMTRAIKSLLQAEQHMQRVLSAISSEPCGDLGEQLVQIISSKGVVSRRDLVRAFRHKLTVSQLDELIRSLVEGNYVTTDVQGANVIYRWVSKKG